jgi:hypothetical protein
MQSYKLKKLNIYKYRFILAFLLLTFSINALPSLGNFGFYSISPKNCYKSQFKEIRNSQVDPYIFQYVYCDTHTGRKIRSATNPNGGGWFDSSGARTIHQPSGFPAWIWEVYANSGYWKYWIDLRNISTTSTTTCTLWFLVHGTASGGHSGTRWFVECNGNRINLSDTLNSGEWEWWYWVVPSSYFNWNSTNNYMMLGLQSNSTTIMWVWALEVDFGNVQIPSPRTINFVGRTWDVKSGCGGPGPNDWSNSTQNVWVDGQGQLHLKIRRDGNIWYCSEVSTQQPTRYGIHRFYIDNRLDYLDRNVVFAPFLYKDDEHEIDIEFSKWGQQNPGYNAQYVVQPSSVPGNCSTFTVQLTGTYTTHYINWRQDSIRFKSIHGHYQEPPSPDYLIHQCRYMGNYIPSQSLNLRTHINLWLVDGNPPSNSQDVEVVVTNADLPSAVMEETNSKVISAISLGQNYPNPFISLTSIRYTVPKDCNVNLAIYNSSGILIRALKAESENTGFYRVTWNGCDEKGKRLAKGVYFYRLQADEFTGIKKMVMLK